MASTPEPHSWLDWIDQKWQSIIMFAVHLGMGLMAILVDLIRRNKLNLKTAFIAVGFGVCGGWISTQLCISFGWVNQMGYLVPLATIGSYKGIPWLIDNSPAIFRAIITRKVGDLKKEDSNG